MLPPVILSAFSLSGRSVLSALHVANGGPRSVQNIASKHVRRVPLFHIDRNRRRKLS